MNFYSKNVNLKKYIKNIYVFLEAHLTCIFFRIGHQSYNRTLPLEIQIYDFFTIREIKFKSNTNDNDTDYANQPVVFKGIFDHEILELKNKYSNLSERKN